MSEGILSLRLGGFELLFVVFGTTLFGVKMLALLSPDPYTTALKISVLIGYTSGLCSYGTFYCLGSRSELYELCM